MNFENVDKEPSSYKDTAGWVFYHDDKVYRKISPEYLVNHYQPLKEKGFYSKAIELDYLIPFTEEFNNGELFLVSEKIDPITYPYEWGMEQMRDMAIFHLDFLLFCLDQDVLIKDASAFNIQFRGQELLFIDLLSFEVIDHNYSWKAYQQFCENYVAPLVLSSYHKINGNKQFLQHLEGISLSNAVNQLPFKANFRGLSFYHLIAQSKFNTKGKSGNEPVISKRKSLQIIRHLTIGIQELKFKNKASSWLNYNENLPYTKEEIIQKENFIHSCFTKKDYLTILDIGANHADFTTRIYPEDSKIILIDNDISVVNQLYKKLKNHHALVLDMDITQPSPSLGLNLKERKSFIERIHPNVIVALALIHHLFHGRNIPLEKIADIFADYHCDLILEYIDPSDEKFIQISNNSNLHPYNQVLFENVFSCQFDLLSKQEIVKGKRWMYHYTFKPS